MDGLYLPFLCVDLLPEAHFWPAAGPDRSLHQRAPVEYQNLQDLRQREPSADLRERVEAARGVQWERFIGTDLASNANMRPTHIRKYCGKD